MTTDTEAPTRPAVYAQVLASGLVIGGEKTLVEVPDPDGGEPEIVEHEVNVTAEVGSIIDVADWAHIRAYVERGQIMLLGPTESKAHAESLAAAQKPSSSTTKKAGTTR